LKLRFPTRLTTKWDCYGFEWANPKLNMTQQLRDNGFDMQPVEGDWNACWTNMSKYVWDTGHLQMKSRNPRCRRDHWAQYHAQFTEGNVCSAS
jgi:hypothetical protein